MKKTTGSSAARMSQEGTVAVAMNQNDCGRPSPFMSA
jgi:hypothetical protein